jgi:predicted  nucleic acid-binding Zn-ribbon protein
MKKSVKLFYLPVLLFLIVTQTRAQDLHKIENDYSIIQAKLKLENVKLDSLKNALDKRAAKIDDEKKKDKPDKDLIVSLMSGSANLSNEIEGQQNKIENTRKSILELSKNLSKIYSEKIDSLQELEKSNEFKGNKNDLW